MESNTVLAPGPVCLYCESGDHGSALGDHAVRAQHVACACTCHNSSPKTTVKDLRALLSELPDDACVVVKPRNRTASEPKYFDFRARVNKLEIGV